MTSPRLTIALRSAHDPTWSADAIRILEEMLGDLWSKSAAPRLIPPTEILDRVALIEWRDRLSRLLWDGELLDEAISLARLHDNSSWSQGDIEGEGDEGLTSHKRAGILLSSIEFLAGGLTADECIIVEQLDELDERA